MFVLPEIWHLRPLAEIRDISSTTQRTVTDFPAGRPTLSYLTHVTPRPATNLFEKEVRLLTRSLSHRSNLIPHVHLRLLQFI